MADRNIVEILITSRNKTKTGFKEAEVEAEVTAHRIAEIFKHMEEKINASMAKVRKNLALNLGKGLGLFGAGSGLLSMAGPFAAAGLAVGAFGAVAIPVLKKVYDAHVALAAAQLKYNQAVTNKQRQAALLAEERATAGLTSQQKGLMGQVSQLGSMWSKLEAAVTPVVVKVASLAIKLASALLPALNKLIPAGAKFLDALIGPLTKFVSSKVFDTLIGQIANLAGQLGSLLGPALVQLIQLFLQLFVQAGPAGIQLLNILLPLIVQLLQDLVPIIVVVAEVTASVLKWVQAHHLLLPLLAAAAVAILALEAPITATVAAVAILIAIGVELGKNWSKIWHNLMHWADEGRHAIATAFDFIRGKIHEAWSDVINFITGHAEQLWHKVTGFFDNIRHDIAKKFDDIRHGAATLISDIVTFFTGLPGKVLNAIGNLGSQIWHSVTSGLGSLGSMIGLATGGIATAAAGGPKGGFTLVGERGPELVKLPRGSHVFPSGQSAGMLGAGGGQQVTITFDAAQSGGLDAMFWTWLQNGVRVRGGDPAMFSRKVAYA